jgi:hypothetical protein
MRKKITAFILLSSITLVGQRIERISDFKEPVIETDFKLKPQNSIIYKTYGSTWFNLQNDLFTLSVLNSSSSSLITFPIFPDSTILLGLTQTGEPVSAWLHGAAEIINPSMTPGNWIDAWGEVVIDSVDIFKGYQRTTASNIVDTLFVDFIKSGPADRYLDVSQNGSYDPGEFLYQSILYDQANNKLIGNQVMRTDTVLLTEADSSSFISSTGINVNDTVAGGDRYGIYIRFQPGYTWTPNIDTLGDYNTFFMISREQDQGKSPLQYWADNAGFSSYVLPVSVRYNQAGGFNGYLTPTAAYIDNWKYEHHSVWYKLTSNELGIKDVNLNVSGVGTFPNPTASRSTVSFVLGKRDNVTMKITDLSGKLIETFSLGNLSSGEHRELIDLSKYNNGNYVLSVNGSYKIITVLR